MTEKLQLLEMNFVELNLAFDLVDECLEVNRQKYHNKFKKKWRIFKSKFTGTEEDRNEMLENLNKIGNIKGALLCRINYMLDGLNLDPNIITWVDEYHEKVNADWEAECNAKTNKI